MPLGFILVTSGPTKKQIVYRNLLGVGGIVEVQALFGEHDILAKVAVVGFEQLCGIVMDTIQTIGSVIDTKTLMARKWRSLLSRE